MRIDLSHETSHGGEYKLPTSSGYINLDYETWQRKASGTPGASPQQPSTVAQNPPSIASTPAQSTTQLAVASPPIPPSSRYSVVINGQSQGPYEIEQLRQMVQQGTLTRDTLVWKEGMAQWASAGTVQELTSLFEATPPTIP